MPDLVIRPANIEDAEMLWRWRNDPLTLTSGAFKAEMTFDQCLTWLTNLLVQKESLVRLLEVDGIAVGIIWYECRELGAAEVFFIVAPEHRGKGYSTVMLRLSPEVAWQSLGVRRLFGVVLTHNERAMRAFLSAGWRCVGWRGRGYSSAAFEYPREAVV